MLFRALVDGTVMPAGQSCMCSVGAYAISRTDSVTALSQACFESDSFQDSS